MNRKPYNEEGHKKELYKKYESMTVQELDDLYCDLAEDTSILWNLDDAQGSPDEIKEFYILGEYLEMKGEHNEENLVY